MILFPKFEFVELFEDIINNQEKALNQTKG